MLCTVGACCHLSGFWSHFILYRYAPQILPHVWILPPLYTVCYALWVLPHTWVLLPLYTVYSVYYAVCMGAATYVGSPAALYCILCILCSVHGCFHMCGTTLTYIMLGILHNMYSKSYCALSALHRYMLHGHVLM